MKKLLLLLTLIMSQGLIAAPIHDAARSGNLDELERILSQNSSSADLDENDVNAVDNNGWTPLYWAAYKGNIEIVKLLISDGADVNAVNKYGMTPLHAAAGYGNAEIVKLLISDDADVNVVNNDGWTPLHYAARGGHAEIVRILLEDPFCDHTITNNNNNIPEEIARSQDSPEIADMLRDAPSVNKKIVNSEHGLKYSYIRYLNRIGITQAEKDSLPRELRPYIINIIKDQKQSSTNTVEDEAGPSEYSGK